jgi:pantoate--beta-alanine ligase
MRVVRAVQSIVKEHAHWTGQIGFVPTMGYLHAGHLSLCQQARTENQIVVVSIFVNPTQFGPHEDLSRYPRDLDRDLDLLREVGVDVVFVPSAAEMYPSGFTSYVDIPSPLTEQGEGASRPGHFRGVATVVLKLFQLVQPHLAYFGQKDAQQVAVISRMVMDFNLPVHLRILPTIRETDGLAISSRNSYLDTASRAAATVLYRALQSGRAAFEAHLSGDPQVVTQAMIDVVTAESLARLDYAEVRDPATFLPLETLNAPALLLIAASVGPARLIDNFVLHADGTWDAGRLATDSLNTLK